MTATVPIIITTGRNPSPEQVCRAKHLAAVLDARFWPRTTSVEGLRKHHKAEASYVVLKTREELRLQGACLYVHPGMLYLKQRDGRAHPLIRAIAPPDGPPVRSILDGTLGTAGDSIHIARVLSDVEIVGCEVSPVLHALLEEGLPRLSREHGRPWADAAKRILPLCVETSSHLSKMAADSVDAVYLDPMFPAARAASSGFGVVRRFANPMAPGPDLMRHALRVARARVVMKVPGASPLPSYSTPDPGWNRRVRGGAVDYLVCELELPNPEWEEPDLGDRDGGRCHPTTIK